MKTETFDFFPYGCQYHRAPTPPREEWEDDLAEIGKYVENYCAFFGGDRDAVMAAPFTVITPDTKNPYRQMYVLN